MKTYDLSNVKLFDPAILSHPHAFYRQVLDEAPVLAFANSDVFLVASHDLVSEACGRPEDFSNDITSLIAGVRSESPEIKVVLDCGWPQEDVLLMSDPPAHTRFRKIVNQAFSLPRVDAIEHKIRRIASRLIDDMAATAACDFHAAFAVPLPVAMIAGELGLPPEDTAKVKRWSTAFIDRLGGMISAERELQCAREVVDFQHAMKAQIDIRLKIPGDDLLSDLVNATVEGEAPLTIGELMSIIQQILVAGNESTTNTLSLGLLTLLRSPRATARLRADRSLIRGAVEEILRITSAVAGSWRIVARDTELGGVRLPKGAKLMLRNASADLDPAVFADPEAFTPERANARTHLAFGRGIHTCIGNLLARRELAVAFEMLLDRFETIELDIDPADIVFAPNVLLRGPSAVPIRYRVKP